MEIKLTKVNVAENPRYKSAESVDEYRKSLTAGELLSPPIDYWIEGTLLNEVRVGDWLLIDRRVRNGVKVPGIMNTSRVVSFLDYPDIMVIHTQNSVYIIDKL